MDYAHDQYCNCEDCYYARGGEICPCCGSLNCAYGESRNDSGVEPEIDVPE